MTLELSMLLYSILFLMLLIAVQSGTAIKEFGPAALAGSRDNLPEPKGPMLGRLKRAVNNSIEALIVFIPLVLIAHVIGLSNESTELAAQLFLFSRIAHAVVYALGLPWVRTLAFAGGLIASVIFIYQIMIF